MFCNNGAVGVSSRKRGREATDAKFPPLPTTNLFSLQNQRPSQPLVFTSLGLDINDQQRKQQQQQKQQGQNLPFSTSSIIKEEDLASQFKEQTDQIDQIIKTHGDQLQRTLADKYERNYLGLVGVAEESMAKRLREKDKEIEKAKRRNAEIEQRASYFKIEAQVWRDKAKKLEGSVASLRTGLQQAMMRRGGRIEEEEGEGEGEAQVEDAESSFVDPERVEPVELACKACGKRAASVMMWPCRHVCVCMKCDAAVKKCPLCQAHKTTSVEVYLS